MMGSSEFFCFVLLGLAFLVPVQAKEEKKKPVGFVHETTQSRTHSDQHFHVLRGHSAQLKIVSNENADT